MFVEATKIAKWCWKFTLQVHFSKSIYLYIKLLVVAETYLHWTGVKIQWYNWILIYVFSFSYLLRTSLTCIMRNRQIFSYFPTSFSIPDGKCLLIVINVYFPEQKKFSLFSNPFLYRSNNLNKNIRRSLLCVIVIL